MTKALVIKPENVFSRDAIHFHDIPVNAYDKTIADELSRYTVTDLLDIWQDMCAIREFETILNEIKIKGAYHGVTYNHAGPGAPFHRPGSRGGRHGVRAHAGRPHLRLAPQPRRDSGQGVLGHPAAQRRRAAADHALLPRRRRAGAGREGLQTARSGNWRCASSSTARTARSSRARPASTAGWAAPCTRSSRRSASIPITPSSAAPAPIAPGRGALQAGQPQARHRGRQHRRRVASAAARSGKASRSPPWTSTASSGTSRSAAACRSSSTA